MNAKRWSGLSGLARAGIVVLATAQVALAVTAWADLARRDADEVRGSKAWWAAAIAINFVGPAAYFTRGRVRR